MNVTINHKQIQQENARARVDELSPYVNALRQAEANLVGEIASIGNPLRLSQRDERRRMQLQQVLAVLRDGSDVSFGATPLGAQHVIQDALTAAGVEVEFEPRIWLPLREAERQLEVAEKEVTRVA